MRKPRAGPYWFRAVSLATRETADFFGWNRRTGAVSAFCLVVGSGVHYAVAGGQPVMDELLLWGAYVFAPIGVFTAVLFVRNVLCAPATMQAEADAKLAEMGAELAALTKAGSVDLQCEAGGLGFLSASIPGEQRSPDWCYVQVETVRVTNRSLDRPASVRLRLQIKLAGDAGGVLFLDEVDHREVASLFPSLTRGARLDWLRSPLDLPPGRTARGTMGFLSAPDARRLRGNPRDCRMNAEGNPDAILELLDYVSGRLMLVQIAYSSET